VLKELGEESEWVGKAPLLCNWSTQLLVFLSLWPLVFGFSSFSIFTNAPQYIFSLPMAFHYLYHALFLSIKARLPPPTQQVCSWAAKYRSHDGSLLLLYPRSVSALGASTLCYLLLDHQSQSDAFNHMTQSNLFISPRLEEVKWICMILQINLDYVDLKVCRTFLRMMPEHAIPNFAIGWKKRRIITSGNARFRQVVESHE
jgi:hypothetical protein